jgi:hypothetical protein
VLREIWDTFKTIYLDEIELNSVEKEGKSNKYTKKEK